MDVLLLLTAFVLGFAAQSIGLPPLLGYLVAGFGLHLAGVDTSPAIEAIADLGVLLLLFGIGLKLRLRTLARPQVWGTASAFAVLSTLAVAALLLALGAAGVALATDLDLPGVMAVAFAFSFCSTVFAVKALEEANESASLAGRVAVGVLILQDLFAVAFLVAMGGLPSPWALLVVPGLLVARPVLRWLLDRSGHGETLLLLGFTLAVAVGAELFSLVGLKADLGALVVGVLLARHPRAPELASRLLDFKDVLLVGFFLSIGLAGVPSAAAWVVAGVLVLVSPLRTVLLFWLMTRFHLRARTSLQGSLTLSTYSEFGLIVVASAVTEGLVDESWISAVAVAVGMSFLLASVIGRLRYRIYSRWGRWLVTFERQPPDPADAVIDVADARVLVFGMGRVGTGVYDEMVKRRGPVVLGVDHAPEKVTRHLRENRKVISGNALDRDFWERVRLHPDIELVVACMGRHQANLVCVRRIREFLPEVRIAAIATYADQVAALEGAGVDIARNLYEEAGQALADDAVAVVYGESLE